MEKKIEIVMQENKDIDIKMDEEKKITIKKEDRKIKADDIFKLLDYSQGDRYSVEKINKNELDSQVIDFFYDLFKDITDKLVEIKIDDV